jgi:hypothetical protein
MADGRARKGRGTIERPDRISRTVGDQGQHRPACADVGAWEAKRCGPRPATVPAPDDSPRAMHAPACLRAQAPRGPGRLTASGVRKG